MAKRIGGPWLTLAELIDLFSAMGCVIGTVPLDIADDDGKSRSVRYLFNPENQAFVSLFGLDDEDRVPPLTTESWERTLGIEIPKGRSR